MLLFAFSGTTVLLGLSGLCLAVLLSIYTLRTALRRSHRGARPDHYAVFRYSRPLHGLALCVALAASTLAINWTQPALGTDLPELAYEPLDEISVDIPITTTPPPPPPPPPPPVIEPVPVDLVDEPEPFQSMDITADDPVTAPEPAPSPDPAPASAPKSIPLPPPPPPIDDSPRLFVQQMPTFGDECPALSGQERKACSDKALLQFIHQHLTYPTLARENGIEGTVVVSFVVEKDGSVSNVTALREVAGGCTAEAIGALEAINEKGRKFSPGIQNEEFVRVKFTIPVQFKLN